MSSPLVPADIIRNMGSGRGWVVAYSGGCDSRVLLELTAAAREHLPGELRAIHVDHGLHPRSADWSDHCALVCKRLDVPLHVERVSIENGSSPEAMAREARYAAFIRVLGSDETLLTAHHLDDQAETLLLRLLRGTGVTGLAAMLPERPLGQGRLRRPMLSVSRAAIRAWAMEQKLQWIDDPSNAQSRADRNFLRLEILPRLESRWPGTAGRLAGAANAAAEARELLDGLADEDGAAEHALLDLTCLGRIPPARQRNLLRRWIQCSGLTPPGRRRLDAGLKMLLEAGADRQPELVWPDGRIRRYRDRLYLDEGRTAPSTPDEAVYWSGDGALELDAGRLTVKADAGGLDPSVIPTEGLRLGFGIQGLRCRPRGRPTRQVNQLFQEAGIPPWLRTSWPILYLGDRIVAVPGICICEGYTANSGMSGLLPEWKPR